VNWDQSHLVHSKQEGEQQKDLEHNWDWKHVVVEMAAVLATAEVVVVAEVVLVLGMGQRDRDGDLEDLEDREDREDRGDRVGHGGHVPLVGREDHEGVIDGVEALDGYRSQDMVSSDLVLEDLEALVVEVEFVHDLRFADQRGLQAGVAG